MSETWTLSHLLHVNTCTVIHPKGIRYMNLLVSSTSKLIIVGLTPVGKIFTIPLHEELGSSTPTSFGKYFLFYFPCKLPVVTPFFSLILFLAPNKPEFLLDQACFFGIVITATIHFPLSHSKREYLMRRFGILCRHWWVNGLQYIRDTAKKDNFISLVSWIQDLLHLTWCHVATRIEYRITAHIQLLYRSN